MARHFNGWTMAGSAPIGTALSATNRATVAFWMWAESYTDPNDQMLFETGPQYDLLTTLGFALYSNTAETVMTLASFGSDSTYAYAKFNRPPTGVWAHWAFVVNRAQTPPINLGPVYVNAVPQALTLTPGGQSDNFPNQNLYVMARNTNFAFMAANLFDLAIWGTVLNADEVTSLANQSNRPDSVQSSNLIGYWPLEGFVSPEPACGGTTGDMTLVGNPPQFIDPPPFAIDFN